MGGSLCSSSTTSAASCHACCSIPPNLLQLAKCPASFQSLICQALVWVAACRAACPQVAVRRRAGLAADCKLEILAAEHDMYVARATGTSGAVTLKLGPRYNMGGLLPKESEGWALVQSGMHYAVWEKAAAP